MLGMEVLILYCIKVCSQPSGKSNDIYDKTVKPTIRLECTLVCIVRVCSQPSGKSNDIFDKTV